MFERRFCPWCGTDQRGRALTDTERESGWWGATNRFWRTEMVEIPGVYDSALFMRCPDCGGSWHRFPEGHPLHAKAEQHVGPPPAMTAALEAWMAAHHDGAEERRAAPGRPDDVDELQRRLTEMRARVANQTRVEIDPNVRVHGNQTFTGLDQVHGPIAVGDAVTVYESEADLEGHGTVTGIDHHKGLVYLDMAWASLQPKEQPNA